MSVKSKSLTRRARRQGLAERAGEQISRTAGPIARGLIAGAAGTAAMTISSTLEAKLRGRGESSAPADAAGEVLGVEPTDEQGKRRFATLVHWGYGTSWGAARGLIDETGLDGPAATATHGALVWGSAAAMLPSLGVAPPIWRWRVKEITIDLFHHGVYAAATGAAYEAISP
jgi:hypothetical protein